MIFLEKGILNIPIHPDKHSIEFCNSVDYTYITKIVARRLSTAIERYKNNIK